MIKKIDHIGINVLDLEFAVKQFSEGLGLKLIKEEELEQWNCKIAFFDCGGVLIELIQPTGEGMAKTFIDEHGEGISHICYEVNDIHETYERAQKYFTVQPETLKKGAGGSDVFFLDKESIFQCDTEFVKLP